MRSCPAQECPAVVRVMANMCCRSRRSLLVSLVAASLAFYYVGSAILRADSAKKDGHSLAAGSGGVTPVQGGGGGAGGDELRDVECVGPKCDKYMKLLGLDRSSERGRGKNRQHCVYTAGRESAEQMAAAAGADGMRVARRRAAAAEAVSACRDGAGAATAIEQAARYVAGTVQLRASVGSNDLSCHLEAVQRGDDDDSVTYRAVAELSNYGPEAEATATASLRGADFHRLSCRYSAGGNKQQDLDSRRGFTQYFAHVDRNEEAVADAREASCNNCLGYNVLILSVEALSQSNFLKYLPQTMDYLTTEMGSVVMGGYNAVGHSNGGTLVPMLTGQHEYDLPEARRGKANSHYTDEFDIIWKDYARSGYVTLFAEDEPHRSTFNAYYHGFEMEPTNHYMRPFWLAVSKDSLKLDREVRGEFCLGSRAKHRFALDYVNDFFEQYKDLKRLAILHHNGLSSGGGEQMALMDADIVGLLHSLRDKGHLNSTVVIVTSDHGSVDGKPAAGPKQRLDARSPALIISVPPNFAKRFEAQAKSLKTNAGRLTTPYDVHATLLDLLDSRRLSGATAQPLRVASRGESLFADVTVNRTCQSAGVDAQWCTCAVHQQLSADDNLSRRAALVVVEAANVATEMHRDCCAQLRLQRILESQRLVLNEQIADYEEQQGKAFDGSQLLENNYIQLTIVVDDASSTVYEATVVHDALKDTLKVTEAGVVRLSAPSDVASIRCHLDDPVAMPFCDCRS